MINGINVFYSSKIGRGVKVASKGLEPMGGGVQPHFCPWKNVCFPIFPHGEKWEKKYMEREGKVFISLSFHILFSPFFPMGKNGKTHIFHRQKWGWTPQPIQTKGKGCKKVKKTS